VSAGATSAGATSAGARDRAALAAAAYGSDVINDAARLRRAGVAFLIAAAIIPLGMLARDAFDRPASTDTVAAGTFTSDSDIRLTNLTINGGHLRVGYSLDVFFTPALIAAGLPTREDAAGLRCGLVDTSGRLDFFEASRTNAPPGVWTHLTFDANYDLPDLTLGIRCTPDESGGLTAVFRRAEVHADPLP